MNQILDADYYKILSVVKAFIHHVDNQDHLKQYIHWLERLYNAPPQEKVQRNEYLFILAEQIGRNVLEAPFTSDPPSGRLPPLDTLENCDDTEKEFDVNHIATQEATLAQSLEHLETVQVSSIPFNSITSRLFEPLANVKVSNVKPDFISDCDATESCTSEHSNFISANISEKTSDLRLDRNHKNDLETELCSKRHLEIEEIHQFQRREDEIKVLQSRMDDLLEVKKALKDAYCITEDRKRIIIELRDKLNIVQKENQELKLDLENQEKISLELNKIKEPDEHQKEIAYLNERHQNEVLNMENTYKSKIKVLELELNRKTDEIRIKLEKTMEELNNTSSMQLKIKDDQIQRLQFEIENNKKYSLQNKIENNELRYFKKCIFKLQKRSEKVEMQHLKEIDQLKREFTLRNMSNEIQWQRQKNELMMKMNMDKQEELKKALDDLECKYKVIVEDMLLNRKIY